MKSPAFQFYPADYLASMRVQMLTLEEEGAYIRLLSYAWLHGSLPAEPDQLARIVGKGASTTLVTTLVTMFQPCPNQPGRLVHDRLEAEREKQAVWRKKSAEGGKKSAAMRSNLKGGSTTVDRVVEGWLPNGTNQKATLQSSSSSSYNTPVVPKGTAPKGPLQLRAEAIFNRRPDTPLTAGEQRAFVKSKAAIEATPEADWALLEAFYKAPQSETYTRTSLATLLNNWNGEIDRARTWADAKHEPVTEIKTRLVAL